VTNRLANETSPYLLQHKDNPVDWYPWGEEALRRARTEDLPVLLSIGYSACHWCHVMERESFEDPNTAAAMNQDFVCIKVDREERPDLDAIYMAAVQQMTGSGGWPMTVFLTPDLKPFYGGTYFPPAPRYGMPSFTDLLEAISEAYRHRRDEVEKNAQELAAAISAEIAPSRGTSAIDASILDNAAHLLRNAHDPVNGGFGSAPKFPQAMALDFMLRSHRRTGDPTQLAVVETSLLAMAHGGIWDHLGGGFARYSTDATWLVPHFEKMLYDQALLAQVYLHAFQVTGGAGYRAGCTRIIDYVLRDLTSDEGGFYSAEDADSEGVEGLFYTWTAGEVRSALGDDAELFARTYGVRDEGNWEGRNILHVAADRSSIPAALDLSVEEYQERLRACREKLFELRKTRVRPARDEKIVTAWNGLMLASVAEAAAVLDREDYLRAAQRNAEMLLTNVVQAGRVLRTYRDGRAKLNGYLEDYAALAHGLLQLYQADFDPRWYRAARELVDQMLHRFRDPRGGIFFSTSDDHEALLFRPKDFDDNAVPAGNSMAAEVLVELSLLSGDDRYREVAMQVFSALGQGMATHPLFFGRLLAALDLHLGEPVEIAVIGDPAANGTKALVREVRQGYRPNKVMAAAAAGTSEPELLAGRTTAGPAAAAYVCRGFACLAPVTSPAALHEQLEAGTMAEGWQAV
jgi:uncharacterized protein YyaL (SSP411 family)